MKTPYKPDQRLVYITVDEDNRNTFFPGKN